jgi:hypothetical protein
VFSINASLLEAEIIDGRGNIPHGRTNIETVRNSYA